MKMTMRWLNKPVFKDRLFYVCLIILVGAVVTIVKAEVQVPSHPMGGYRFVAAIGPLIVAFGLCEVAGRIRNYFYPRSNEH